MKFINIIFLFLLLLSSCGTPNPPLKEGEIPFRMKPGVYLDTEGNKHIVTIDNPRWSVSEAYLFDSVINARDEKNNKK